MVSIASHAGFNPGGKAYKLNLPEISEWAHQVRFVWQASGGNNSPAVTLVDSYGNTLHSWASSLGYTSYDSGWITPSKIGKVFRVSFGTVPPCGGSTMTASVYARNIGGEPLLASFTTTDSYAGSTHFPSYASTERRRLTIPSYLRNDIVTSTRVAFTSTGGAMYDRLIQVYGADNSTVLGTWSGAGSQGNWAAAINNTDGIVKRIRIQHETYDCGNLTGNFASYATINGTEYLVGSTSVNVPFPLQGVVTHDIEYGDI